MLCLYRKEFQKMNKRDFTRIYFIILKCFYFIEKIYKKNKKLNSKKEEKQNIQPNNQNKVQEIANKSYSSMSKF